MDDETRVLGHPGHGKDASVGRMYAAILGPALNEEPENAFPPVSTELCAFSLGDGEASVEDLILDGGTGSRVDGEELPDVPPAEERRILGGLTNEFFWAACDSDVSEKTLPKP